MRTIFSCNNFPQSYTMQRIEKLNNASSVSDIKHNIKARKSRLKPNNSR